jgi:siroheme synthase (precorrin-2 oxidase/ferrochelatase)
MVHKFWLPGSSRIPYFLVDAQYLWVLSTDLAACHPSDTLDFQISFHIFGKFFGTRAYNSISKNFSQFWPQKEQCQESTYSNYYILILATSFLFNIKLRITCSDAHFALCNLIHKSAAFSVWTPSILNISKVYYSPTNAQVNFLKKQY